MHATGSLEYLWRDLAKAVNWIAFERTELGRFVAQLDHDVDALQLDQQELHRPRPLLHLVLGEPDRRIVNQALLYLVELAFSFNEPVLSFEELAELGDRIEEQLHASVVG